MCKYIVDFSAPEDSIMGKTIVEILFEKDNVLSLWDGDKRVAVYTGGYHRLHVSIADTLDGYNSLMSFLRLMGEEHPQISGLTQDIIDKINGGMRMVIVRNFKNCEEIQVG